MGSTARAGDVAMSFNTSMELAAIESIDEMGDAIFDEEEVELVSKRIHELKNEYLRETADTIYRRGISDEVSKSGNDTR